MVVEFVRSIEEIQKHCFAFQVLVGGIGTRSGFIENTMGDLANCTPGLSILLFVQDTD